MSVTFILPAYNESRTISKQIKLIQNQYPNYRILVVDNNSDDNTYEISKKLIGENNVLKENRQGKGYAVSTAFKNIDTEYIILLDADCTYGIESVNQTINLLKNGYDLVLGNRMSENQYYNENKRRFHSFGNKLVIFITNFFFNSKFKDCLTGYRGMTKKFSILFPCNSSGYEIETEMNIFATMNNFKTCSIDVKYNNRPNGSFSKLNTFLDGIKILKSTFSWFRFYRPFFFFSVIAIICAIISIIFGLIVFYEFLNTGLIYRIPSALMSVGFGIISIIFFVVGVLLDFLSKTQKQNINIWKNFLTYKKK